MTTEKLEQLVAELKEVFQKYSEKKSFTVRKDVRKVLQQIKTEAQTFRLWLLEDFK